MPAPQGEDHADDVDPTGIRDLLAALPDPGPMPEDLVRRIQARLEVERAHQDARGPHAWLPAGDTVGTPSEDPADSSPGGALAASAVSRADSVFDLAAERSHRRPARTVAVLGAAAAGLLVTTVAVTQFMGFSDGAGSADTAASYPSLTRSEDSGGADAGGGSAEDSAGDEAFEDLDEQFAAADGGSEAAASDGETPESLAGEGDSSGSAADDSGVPRMMQSDPEVGGRLQILPDLGPVTTQDLSATLRAALDDDDVRYDQGDLTLEQARSCWQALATEHPFAGHVAARAQFVASGEGQPVVALLGMQDDGTGQVWILPAGCAQDADTVPLSGPYPFD